MNPYLNEPFVAKPSGTVGQPNLSSTASSISRNPQTLPKTDEEWMQRYGPQLCDYMERAGAVVGRSGVLTKYLDEEARNALRAYPGDVPVGVKEYAIDCFMKGYNESSTGGRGGASGQKTDDDSGGMTIGGLLVVAGVLGVSGLFAYNWLKG